MNQSLNKVCQRISVLETKVDDIQQDITHIKNNELVHLHNKIESIEFEVNKVNTNFKVYKAKTAVWASIGIFVATFIAQIVIKLWVK